MARNNATAERERLMVSLADSLPDSGGGYEVSSAFLAPERRRLVGRWAVGEHTVDGRPWLEIFIATNLKGAELLEAAYSASYGFRESVCVKHACVEGFLELPEGRTAYSWRMGMAIGWEPGRGILRVKPELGYQVTSLGDKPVAVREFGSQAGSTEIEYRLEGGLLILEEGGDHKVLKRGGA